MNLKKILSLVLVLGLLGFGSISFAGQTQESEEIIKVPGASEDFKIDKNWTDEQKEMPNSFFQMTTAYFIWGCATQDDLFRRLNAETVETDIAWTVGVDSNKPAIILHNFGINSANGQTKNSDLVIVYYIEELEEIIDLYSKLFNRYCEFQYNNKFLLLLPEAKETAQKFVDDIKKKFP